MALPDLHSTGRCFRLSWIFANSSLVRPRVRCFCCLFLFALIFHAIFDSCEDSSSSVGSMSWSSRPLFVLAFDLVGSNVLACRGSSNTCLTFSATGGFGRDPSGSLFHSFTDEFGVLGVTGVVGFDSFLFVEDCGMFRLRLLGGGFSLVWLGIDLTGEPDFTLAFNVAWRLVIRGMMFCPDRPRPGKSVPPLIQIAVSK